MRSRSPKAISWSATKNCPSCLRSARRRRPLGSPRFWTSCTAASPTQPRTCKPTKTAPKSRLASWIGSGFSPFRCCSAATPAPSPSRTHWRNRVASKSTLPLFERFDMTPTNVEEILRQIQELSENDRRLLEKRMAQLADEEWQLEAAEARRVAKEKGLDQAAIDKAIEETR